MSPMRPPQPAPARRLPAWLAGRMGVDVDPALRPAVGDEQLRMVLSHTRLGTLVATAFALFFALQLRGTALPAWAVDLWLAAKLLVAGSRIVLSLRYDRLGRPGGTAWRNTTDAWLLADGVVWGVAGLLVYSSDVPLAALVSSVMACVSCVATFGLQVSKRSTAAYVSPILAFTAIALLLRGDQLGTIGGTGLLGLLALLVTTAAASERRLIEDRAAAAARPGTHRREGRGAETGVAPERGEDPVPGQHQP